MSDSAHAYRLRAAYGVWINDMRSTPLPLERWPAPQFDDGAIEGLTRAMDVQAEAGFNMFDVWGLFATYGWPMDLASAVTPERDGRIRQVLAAAHERGLKLILGMGVYSWGYDQIIEADPEVRGQNEDGSPHPHAMCDAHPRAFDYVRRILDFVLDRYDFDGVHLESCDLGCCLCERCAGGQGKTAYNVQINAKTADYIRAQWPDKVIYAIPIAWLPTNTHFNADEQRSIIELSNSIDCFMDQGHRGTFIPASERREFISRLHCDYGTSAGLWLYPDARWERCSYFVPYARRTGRAIRDHFADGARGCMFYQGPMVNPATEITVAVGGRLLSDTRRTPEEALADAIGHYYRPETQAVHDLLVDVFLRAEEGYFGQWVEERFRTMHNTPMPGQVILDGHLQNTSPGPAAWLLEPFLDADGRLAYRRVLCSILKDLDALPDGAADTARLERIRRSLIVSLMLLNTAAFAKGEQVVVRG